MEVMLAILIFSFSNVDIQFVEKKLICGSYNTAKVLLTTKQIELINKKNALK